ALPTLSRELFVTQTLPPEVLKALRQHFGLGPHEVAVLVPLLVNIARLEPADRDRFFATITALLDLVISQRDKPPRDQPPDHPYS
ncbi:MAG: hypothetical protein KIT87_25530, partial [Anaerolineae bacterium]|nr:hypothetical protein [Anaerolineae bacterium]